MPTPPRFDTSAAPAPHGGGLVLVAPRAHGNQGESAVAAAIYLHGRGASAQDILSLHDEFATPRLLGFAPEAAGNSWYPYSFLAPIHENAAGIDSAHAVIELLIKQCAARGIPAERVALVGFSQGACLALDHAWRFPRRYGAIIAFTGAIIVDHQIAVDRRPQRVSLGRKMRHRAVPFAHCLDEAVVLRGEEPDGAALLLSIAQRRHRLGMAVIDAVETKKQGAVTIERLPEFLLKFL